MRSKAKTAKHSASPFGMPNYEMPKFDVPKMEMPEAFREMAEKGVAQAKDSYEKIQAAAEEATDLPDRDFVPWCFRTPAASTCR